MGSIPVRMENRRELPDTCPPASSRIIEARRDGKLEEGRASEPSIFQRAEAVPCAGARGQYRKGQRRKQRCESRD